MNIKVVEIEQGLALDGRSPAPVKGNYHNFSNWPRWKTLGVQININSKNYGNSL